MKSVSPVFGGTAVPLAVTWLVWGTTYLAIAFGLRGTEPLTLSSVRFLTAGLLLWALAERRHEPRLTALRWRRSALVGVLLFSVGMGGVALAEEYVDSGTTALFIATVPLWSVLLNTAGGRPTRGAEWAGVWLGLAGVAVLSAGLGRGGLTGAAILLPAAICWVLGSHLDDHSAGVRGPAAQMLAGGAVLAVAAAVRGEFASPPRPTWGAGLALAYLVVFGSLLAMAAYRHLTAHTSPALATSYAFITPVIAVLSGALVLDEPLTPHVLAGTALIAVAVSITLLTRSRPAAGPTTTVPGHPEAVRVRRRPASSR
ncbi:EamA family transporter (plasmid) [Streptomyces scopuliridis]|uniref:EamA family transporter n=1 Tax=Streptomyces scopuliridis TaxID=452529 RepID=A0ACD4ZY77_9ACTN|nr:EamA family transporter [Streptomyces scopuliridis]WSC03488.1 EamA family transporter [Streptomyces scopuliridis]WSC11367.1 EamA family transporter [Streptomyces scopuliridis]